MGPLVPVLRLVQKLWPHLITLWNVPGTDHCAYFCSLFKNFGLTLLHCGMCPGTDHCGIVLGVQAIVPNFAACSKNFGLTFNLLPSQFITGHGHSRLSVPSTFHNTISTGLRTKYIHKAFAGTSLFPPPEVLLHTHNSQALAES